MMRPDSPTGITFLRGEDFQRVATPLWTTGSAASLLPLKGGGREGVVSARTGVRCAGDPSLSLPLRGVGTLWRGLAQHRRPRSERIGALPAALPAARADAPRWRGGPDSSGCLGVLFEEGAGDFGVLEDAQRLAAAAVARAPADRARAGEPEAKMLGPGAAPGELRHDALVVRVEPPRTRH